MSTSTDYTKPTPTMSIQERAEHFASHSAKHISPLSFYAEEAYGKRVFANLTLPNKITVLEIVDYAATWEKFNTVFEKRRAIIQAIGFAQTILTGSATPQYARFDVAELIGKLSLALAYTYEN